MRNVEVAWIFYELADLLELKGEDFFKIRAYRNAAKILAGLDRPLAEIWSEGKMVKIPGIGKNISAKISEILETGSLQKHEGLLREFPPGFLEIVSLPGIGPKKAALFRERLGVTTLAELARAAREKRVRTLPGMGSKTESEIIRNIEMRENRESRVLLATARELAAEISDYLRAIPGVKEVEAGGSLRRWRETVGDIDLVVAGEDPRTIIEAAADYPRFQQILERSPGRARFLTNWGIIADLEVTPEETFYLALFRNTGSRAHYRKIQQLFAERGLTLDKNVIAGEGAVIREEDIYAALGLPWISPELREDRGEVEAALENRLPGLLKSGDLKGDLHIHTNWSDGINSIEQMVQRARAKGYQYIAITDHSRSLKIAGGLSLERLQEQHEQIRKMNGEYSDFHIFTGIEVDILPRGGLDYPDEILEKIDVVVASVHSAFKQDRETMTTRILSAVENKNVDIIGHLTGRLLLQREGYGLDLERVLDAAAGYGTILEINASPDRLDLNDLNVRKAKEKGIKIAINTDAHDLKRLDEMPYGVSVARRAWLEPDDVINTRPVEDLIRFFRGR
jgi:DNA polymerase (family 10)